MKRYLRSILNPSMAVAMLALVVAIGGTSYAAASLSRNSVGSAQIKAGAVKTVDLANRAVTSPKIKNGTISSKDLAPAVTEAQPVLRSGQTMRGFFAAGGGGDDGYLGDAVTFPQRLPASFDPTHVEYLSSGSTSANCPGAGQAAPGWACIYLAHSNSAYLCCVYGDDRVGLIKVSHYGFRIYWRITGTLAFADGAWAVTAP